MDYYSILGVSKGASDAEIKSAYRKKALEWHPDRNKSPEAADTFKKINKAYETLSDPKKKQMYDQIGHDAYERGGAGFGGSGNPGGGYSYQQGPFQYSYSTGGFNVDFGDTDPFDIFEQFFGFQSPFGGRAQGGKRRQLYEMRITFDEAVHGVERETVIAGEKKSIKIPAGVDNGMRIRFQEFDVLVNVQSHKFFKREGQDVYLEKDISLSQAILGATIEVPTVHGSVKVKVRSGTQPDTVMRLREQGVPYPNTTRKGDQYIIFKVAIPKKITNKGKKLLADLEKEIS